MNKEEFNKVVIENKEEVLVDFYATWCGPCNAMSEIVDSLENIKVCRIDVDDEQELALSYGVMSIPTFISFKDGKEYKKKIGMCSKEDLEELMK